MLVGFKWQKKKGASKFILTSHPCSLSRIPKHQLLYKMLKPLMMDLVKKQTKRSVEDGVRTALEYCVNE